MTDTTTHENIISDTVDASVASAIHIEAIPADTTDHSAALSATFTTAAIIAVLVLVLVLLGAKGGRK